MDKDCNDKSIGFMVRVLSNMLRRRMDSNRIEWMDTNLGGMQAAILGFIYRCGKERDIYQKDVEKEFNIRRSSATVTLQNLEQKGYIVRVPSESDGRLKKIVLTDKAVNQNKLIEQRIQAFNDEIEEGISEKEKEIFMQVALKVIANLEREGSRENA